MPYSIPVSRQYIPTACIRVSYSFSFLANCLISTMYIRWFVFSCNLWSFYPPLHFLSIWLSGIITITNSNGDSASSWKTPLWIFTSVKLFPPAVSSTPQFSIVFTIHFMTSPDILYILRQSIIQLYGTI